MNKTNTMLEPYKAPTAKTIMVDLKSSYLQVISNTSPQSEDFDEQGLWEGGSNWS